MPDYVIPLTTSLQNMSTALYDAKMQKTLASLSPDEQQRQSHLNAAMEKMREAAAIGCMAFNDLSTSKDFTAMVLETECVSQQNHVDVAAFLQNYDQVRSILQQQREVLINSAVIKGMADEICGQLEKMITPAATSAFRAEAFLQNLHRVRDFVCEEARALWSECLVEGKKDEVVERHYQLIRMPLAALGGLLITALGLTSGLHPLAKAALEKITDVCFDEAKHQLAEIYGGASEPPTPEQARIAELESEVAQLTQELTTQAVDRHILEDKLREASSQIVQLQQQIVQLQQQIRNFSGHGEIEVSGMPQEIPLPPGPRDTVS